MCSRVFCECGETVGFSCWIMVTLDKCFQNICVGGGGELLCALEAVFRAEP